MRPEQLNRHAVQQEGSGRRLLLVAAFILALAAIGYGVAREAQDPRFDARIGAVRGLGRTSAFDVLAAAEIDPHQNAWLVNRRAAVRRIEALPWVQSASIAVVWPNTVKIDVIERLPVARVEVAGGPQARDIHFAVIDDTQRVLSLDRPGDWPELPLLAIVPPPSATQLPGSTLGSAGVSEALTALRQLRHLGLLISAVAIAPSTGISATADRNLRVLFGADEDLARKAQIFQAIVAKISTPQRIAYIDVRSVRAPTVLYR